MVQTPISVCPRSIPSELGSRPSSREVQEKVIVDFQCTPGSGLVAGPNGEELCTWYEDMTLNTTASKLEFNELRFNTNIPDNEFGRRQYLSLNFQVWTPKPNLDNSFN